MKFCPNCGAQLADESKFCMECGQKIEAAPAAPAPEMNYAPAPEMSYAPVQPEAPVNYAPVQPEAAPSYAPAQPEAPVYAPQGYAPAQPEAPAYAPQGYAPAQPEAPAYAPPTPQGYAPQNGYAPPAAPKQPKKGGKKTGLFIGIGVAVVAVIAVLLIVLLGGGGAAKDDPNLGVYNCVSYEVLGVSTKANGEWIELKAKNKATVSILETEFDGKWALEGDALTLTMTGVDYEGTLSNGVIEIDLFGLVYTFAKDGAVVATPTPTPETPEDGGDTAEATDEPEPETPAIAPFSPVTATWGDYTVTVNGAEHFVDSDGNDSVRVYYDFTNNSAETTSPWMELDINATQDGYEAEFTYAAWGEEVPEDGNNTLELRPGCSNRCIEEFSMKVDGGAVVVTFAPSWSDGEPLVVNLDPQNLPGRPAADFQIAAVTDPQWLSDRSDLGVIDGEYEVYIDSAETLKGYDDEPLMRVYFDFTNKSAEPCSFFWACNVSAYQDGVELPTGWAPGTVAEDDNYYNDVQPGASIRVAVIFEYRSSSPIEIEINNTTGEGGIGCNFYFNQ